jgi:benzoyl-CoA reductase/2-hydroxyglutaryl-CoA dehydratase subunit BcrC/BadD/HgdB
MQNTQESKTRINKIVRACRLISRMSKAQSEQLESHRIYYQMLADYYTRLMNAERDGDFVAAHTIFFPVEILYSMDIVPMHTELTSWMAALFSGSCAELLSSSDEVGLAQEICSPYRVLTGAIATHSVTRPDTILWSNLICDNAGKCGELVMHMADCTGFFLDCPFQKTDKENAYLKKEIENVIAFLEKQTGRKIDWNKLSENIARMDEQIELVRDINRLRQTVPSPFSPQDILKLFTVDCMFAGQPEATDYLRALRQELVEKKNRDNEAPSSERFRIMNILFPPVLLLPAIERVSLEYGVVPVADPLLCHWGEGRLDPQKPIDSILKKIEINPVMVMYGPLDENKIRSLVDCAVQYKVDGAIHYAHVGCRQSAALIKILKERLNDIDVPVLILDCDIIDTTVTPEQELCQKLEQFYELLEER